MPQRDTVRLPLEPLRRRVAEATGRSAAFVDLTDVELAENALEVTFETPDEDVPIAEVVVESDGRTETIPIELDAPSGLKVHGELLRIEYAGRDAETDDVLVSVDRREDDEWKTLLGCGQMWAVETTRDGESTTITCRVETPSPSEDEEDADEETEGGSPVADAESSSDDESTGGFLNSLD